MKRVEIIVKDIMIREVEGGFITTQERVPVFKDGEILKDKVGRTIWKVVGKRKRKYKFKKFYLVFSGEESVWMTIAEMTNSYGKKKTKTAIKLYIDRTREEQNE